jgi:hypothetical protein
LLSGVGKDAIRDLIHKVQEVLESRGNLSTTSGDPRYMRTSCSDPWAIHQRKCKNGKKVVL